MSGRRPNLTYTLNHPSIYPNSQAASFDCCGPHLTLKFLSRKPVVRTLDPCQTPSTQAEPSRDENEAPRPCRQDRAKPSAYVRPWPIGSTSRMSTTPRQSLVLRGLRLSRFSIFTLQGPRRPHQHKDPTKHGPYIGPWNQDVRF